jgi:hypothetical protein
MFFNQKYIKIYFYFFKIYLYIKMIKTNKKIKKSRFSYVNLRFLWFIIFVSTFMYLDNIVTGIKIKGRVGVLAHHHMWPNNAQQKRQALPFQSRCMILILTEKLYEFPCSIAFVISVCFFGSWMSLG